MEFNVIISEPVKWKKKAITDSAMKAIMRGGLV